MLCPLPAARPPWPPALISVTQQMLSLTPPFGARLGIIRENPVLLHCMVFTTCPEPKRGLRELKEWLETSLPLKQQQREHEWAVSLSCRGRSTFCSPLRAWHRAPHPELHLTLLHQLFTVTLQACLGGLGGIQGSGAIRCCHSVGCVSANSGCSAKPCSFPCNCYG